jgi:hypothetical protein
MFLKNKMGFIELICDSNTSFESSNPEYESTDTPTFNFGQGYRNVTGLKVMEVVFPVSWYNWNQAFLANKAPGRTSPAAAWAQTGWRLLNPKVRWFFQPDVFGYYMNTVIENGWYTKGMTWTATEIAAEMTILLNDPVFLGALLSDGLVGPYDNKVVYDAPSQRFMMQVKGTSGILANPLSYFVDREYDSNRQIYTGKGRSIIATMMGMEMGDNYFTNAPPGPSGTVQTYVLFSPYAASPMGFNSVYLCSKTLGPLFKIQPNFQTEKNDVYNYVQDSAQEIAFIPLSVDYGQVQTWQAPEKTGYFETTNPPIIQKFDLFFTLGPYNQTPISFNGLGFQVKLLLEVNDTDLDFNESKKRKYY